MSRLRYEEVGKLIISVDLQNNYSIIAIANWFKNNDNFEITLFLKREDIDMLSLIEEKNKIKFNSNMKSIRADIASYITQLSIEGFFKKYIDRYEYELKCFDRGCEIFESERLSSNSMLCSYKLP